MNRSIENLTEALYGGNVSFKEFESLVDDMSKTVFDASDYLDVDEWKVTSKAFQDALNKVFDPAKMKASAMLTQQAADNIADTAAAAKMLGDNTDTSRQFQIMFDKLNLLDNEVMANNYIMSKAKEYQQFIKTGNVDATVSWLTRQAGEFDGQLKRIRNQNSRINDELLKISKENPQYFRPLKEAFFNTDGKVDELHKLKQIANDNISLIRKGFIDGDPEMPSLLVKQMHSARINSLLSGLSPLRALVGNSTLTFAKPISVMAGAKLTGQTEVYKRSKYIFGGVGESFRRGFKVMQREFKLAMANPEEAMMRGRSDLQNARMDKLDYMDSMADVWRQE